MFWILVVFIFLKISDKEIKVSLKQYIVAIIFICKIKSQPSFSITYVFAVPNLKIDDFQYLLLLLKTSQSAFRDCDFIT